MSNRLIRRLTQPNRLFGSVILLALVGCATQDNLATQPIEPDPRFAGVVTPGDVRGDRSAQVLGAFEARLLQTFPRASWSPGKAAHADVALDVTVYSAKTTDTRSTQEQRLCRRWSEPDKDAKGTVQRLLSRSCVDWQVQQIPCVTRKYELDVQIRARQRDPERVVASDRRVATSNDRKCGNETPATAALQAQAETEIATWAVNLLKSPLAQIGQMRAASVVTTTPAVIQAPPAIEVATHQTTTQAAPTRAPASPVEAHALVIGNASYPGSARLANPLNDARAIEQKLASFGFRVTRIDDGDRETLVRGLSQFQQTAANSQLTVLYYSGHGMQIDGVNYLIPVNIDVTKPATFKLQALPVDTIIDTYLPGRTRVVFLDACRDNPALTASVRGFNRGLAPMQVPTGTLIAYATRDGGVAEDGSGRHSPFTQALLDLIAEPEDISLILRKVRDRVMRETFGRQQPWEYGSLSGGELVFVQLGRR